MIREAYEIYIAFLPPKGYARQIVDELSAYAHGCPELEDYDHGPDYFSGKAHTRAEAEKVEREVLSILNLYGAEVSC